MAGYVHPHTQFKKVEDSPHLYPYLVRYSPSKRRWVRTILTGVGLFAISIRCEFYLQIPIGTCIFVIPNRSGESCSIFIGCQNTLKIYIFNYGSVRLFKSIIIESILKFLVIFCF